MVRREESDPEVKMDKTMNSMFVKKTLFATGVIFCSNSRKSHGDGSEECPKPEHEAKQRSNDPASKGNPVLKRNRDSTNELDDITSKKVCR